MLSRRLRIGALISACYLAFSSMVASIADEVILQLKAVLEPITLQKAEFEMASQAAEKTPGNRSKPRVGFGSGESAKGFVAMVKALNSRSSGTAFA